MHVAFSQVSPPFPPGGGPLCILTSNACHSFPTSSLVSCHTSEALPCAELSNETSVCFSLSDAALMRGVYRCVLISVKAGPPPFLLFQGFLGDSCIFIPQEGFHNQLI